MVSIPFENVTSVKGLCHFTKQTVVSQSLLAGEPVHFVMRVKSRFGKTLWLQINATCVDRQNGCPVYLAIFIDITDVTELRKMQKRLTEQTEALKDALSVA